MECYLRTLDLGRSGYLRYNSVIDQSLLGQAKTCMDKMNV